MPNLTIPPHLTLWIYTAVLFWSSCQTSLSPNQYQQWIAENGDLLTTSQSESALRATLRHLPADWLALQEAGGKPVEFAKAKLDYAGLEYYQLRVAVQSGNSDVLQYAVANEAEYYQRVSYFSFGFQHDLHLLIGNDTLPCKLFHFERNYGSAPYMDFMIGFEVPLESQQDRTLLYYDIIYAQRVFALTIPFANLNRIPNLKL
jgi:hypothetical protein